MVLNLDKYSIKNEVKLSKDDLIFFENRILEIWEQSKIRGPVHFSNGNEEELIEIFKVISKNDWVLSTWRSHYHALLKGIDEKILYQKILEGKSISICDIDNKFYSSAIVASTISIGLGLAMDIKRKCLDEKVWCFIGDMAFETGLFYESYKYAKNFDLPLYFIVEDNNFSTNTPTDIAWNKKREIPEDVIYYTYKSKYPHYGTGKWLIF